MSALSYVNNLIINTYQKKAAVIDRPNRIGKAGLHPGSGSCRLGGFR
jgi:hypothetical protein